MKTIQILRVENRIDGIGIFRGRYGMKGFAEIHARHTNFNLPCEDDLDLELDDKEWFCAYKTVEQFQEWVMADEIRWLIEEDYDVQLLEVSDYQIGEHQVVFTKESIVNSTILNDLFK